MPISFGFLQTSSATRCRLVAGATIAILSLSFLILSITISSNAHEQQDESAPATMQAQQPRAPSQSDANELAKSKELRANEALSSIRNWALRFGRDIFYATQEASCFRVLHDQFDPSKSDKARRGPYRASVISNDWTSMHADIVRTISNTMGWHKSAVESIARASERLAKNHTFDEALRFDYVDVHRLYDSDPDEFQPDAVGTLDSVYPPDLNPDGLDAAAPSSSSSLSPVSGEQEVQTTPPPPPPLPIPQELQSDRNYSTLMETSDVEWQTPARYLKLERHPNFGDVPISAEDSAVHVPVHIFPGDAAVMNGIAWSDSLTKVFKDNFVRNPKLTNQYFASQSGFMRLFPAQRWQIPRTDPDLYDARMRPWYVAGASSRKEVVILVDASGSMTGSRRDIAKGVVFEILDTLTDNDNFLILKFSDIVQQVGVPSCERMRIKRRRGANIPLKNQLYHLEEAPSAANSMESHASVAATVAASNPAGEAAAAAATPNGTDVDSLYFLPANGRNVRYAKTNFTIATSGIANFSHALVTAFEVLLKYQDSRALGAQCNQAIMLITDGSPSDFEEIFNRYNYPNAPVRVFTYLIGRETGDGTHTKMMACHNRGYYTHVINLAEVRETVQQYVPVMARPLVLSRTHPITWTAAYGELTYQMLTDWIWESRRRERARAILAAKGRGALSNQRQQQQQQQAQGYVPDISVSRGDSDGEESARRAAGLGAGPLEGQPPTRTLNGEEANHQGGETASSGSPTFSTDPVDEFLEQELDAIDILGYNKNPDCFWEMAHNDLLTTVVQPVHDLKNESKVVERFLNKNTWMTREMVVRTANLLGVAAADMKINDIIALAPSHKLGPNGYAIMLTNNGLVMHHPDLRSILEPGFMQMSSAPPLPQSSADASLASATARSLDRGSRILKPFFSSLDFTQVEHVLKQSNDGDFVKLRQEAVAGLTGWRELDTKRTLDCQRRVQSRKQSFYYKSLDQFPFSFIIAIPQPYGSHRLEAQIDIKSAPSTLPEKLTTYFTTSDFDVWTVHPDYEYCQGQSNNTIATLLDMFQRIQANESDQLQAKPAESSKPPVPLPGKIIYDKDLIQSLVYDAVATYGFSDSCSLPSAGGDGLTRVRHFVDDVYIKREALAFARRHSRGPDETFYKRTVDYNMLINDTATLIHVPFNMHEKILDRLMRYEQTSTLDKNVDEGELEALNESAEMALFEKLDILANSSLHAIATQSIIVSEGTQRAVAGVTGVFYDYAQFVQRLLNMTNTDFEHRQRSSMEFVGDEQQSGRIRCGYSNDTIDCLLVDNNGYIVFSEELELVGHHLQAYDSTIMSRLVAAGVYHELNVTDYQSICLDSGDKDQDSSSSSSAASTMTSCLWPAAAAAPGESTARVGGIISSILLNLISILGHIWTLLLALGGLALGHLTTAASSPTATASVTMMMQPSMMSLIPNKTLLRPCERILTRHETRPGVFSSEVPEYYTTHCDCSAWFVYEQVAQTNLILIVVDNGPGCRDKCDQIGLPYRRLHQADQLNTKFNIIGQDEKKVCSMIERESRLYKKTLDSCFSHHPDEEHISLCGSAVSSARLMHSLILCMLFISSMVLILCQVTPSVTSR